MNDDDAGLIWLPLSASNVWKENTMSSYNPLNSNQVQSPFLRLYALYERRCDGLKVHVALDPH